MENANEKQLTVGLFDDHPVVLDAVRNALQTTGAFITLSFATSSKNELIALVAGQEPDVLVLDIIAEDVSALELFERFRRTNPAMLLIAYSSLSSPVLVENLLFFGVRGFVNKRQPLEELIRTICLVSEGKICVPEDYRYLTSEYRGDNTALLSEREASIVKLIAAEHTSAEIGAKLGISINTVENHRKRIFLKLNVKNVAGMVLEATRIGYLQ